MATVLLMRGFFFFFFCAVPAHLGTCSQNKTKRFCNFTQLLTPPLTLFMDAILKQRQIEWYYIAQIFKCQNVCCAFILKIYGSVLPSDK